MAKKEQTQAIINWLNAVQLYENMEAKCPSDDYQIYGADLDFNLQNKILLNTHQYESKGGTPRLDIRYSDDLLRQVHTRLSPVYQSVKATQQIQILHHPIS